MTDTRAAAITARYLFASLQWPSSWRRGEVHMPTPGSHATTTSGAAWFAIRRHHQPRRCK